MLTTMMDVSPFINPTGSGNMKFISTGNMKTYGEYSPIVVFCEKCSEWVAEADTKFVSIEEDFQGKDLLTYICPYCKSSQKSYRVGK